MSKIVVMENVSLDGVMQAPGRADEDTHGGFVHGGGALPGKSRRCQGKDHGGWDGQCRFPAVREAEMYEDFYRVGPNRTDNPFTAVLDNAQKYVASRTLTEPLPWQNSTLLRGEAADTVARLKKQAGKDILIMGSGELGQIPRSATNSLTSSSY